MTRLKIQTPSRLHFGLLAWGVDAPRQFGGVGLMIDAPGIELTAEPSAGWSAVGPLAARALKIAEHVGDRLVQEELAVVPAKIRIRRAPREHVGLGVGTQLSLAMAEMIAELAGIPLSLSRLAELAGRGLRSGIGLHGYRHGGLIVDGGRRSTSGTPPLLVQQAFPADWSVLVVIPDRTPGLHGSDEQAAFEQLPPISERMTDRLSRLILLGILPAVIERDLPNFGESLTELQSIVGRCFSPAQGGSYSQPGLESIVTYLREEGFHGVGQSSWGPALYGFTEQSLEPGSPQLNRLRTRLGLGTDSIFGAKASPSGRILVR